MVRAFLLITLAAPLVYADSNTDRAILIKTSSIYNELVKLSSYKFSDPDIILPNWKPIGKLTFPGILPEYVNYRLYKRDTGETILVFPGSQNIEPSNSSQTSDDMWASFYDALANKSHLKYFFASCSAAIKGRSLIGDDLILVGFSQGGMQAETAAKLVGLRAICFQSPGIPRSAIAEIRNEVKKSANLSKYLAADGTRSRALVVNKERDPVAEVGFKNLANFLGSFYHSGEMVRIPATSQEYTFDLLGKNNLPSIYTDHKNPYNLKYGLSLECLGPVITMLSGQDGIALINRLKLVQLSSNSLGSGLDLTNAALDDEKVPDHLVVMESAMTFNGVSPEKRGVVGTWEIDLESLIVHLKRNIVSLHKSAFDVAQKNSQFNHLLYPYPTESEFSQLIECLKQATARMQFEFKNDKTFSILYHPDGYYNMPLKDFTGRYKYTEKLGELDLLNEPKNDQEHSVTAGSFQNTHMVKYMTSDLKIDRRLMLKGKTLYAKVESIGVGLFNESLSESQLFKESKYDRLKLDVKSIVKEFIPLKRVE